MKTFVQNRFFPCQIPLAFEEATDGTVTHVRWAVAYITSKGCKRLMEVILPRIGLARWMRVSKTVITCVDYGLTEPDAVQILCDLPNCTVMLSSPETLDSPRFIPRFAFHPKLFIFDKPQRGSVVSGSANLTESGMTSNTEIVTLDEHDHSWELVWERVLDGAIPFDRALLARYREKRERTPIPPLETPQQPAPVVEPNSLPLFWDQVDSGAIVPDTFRDFWVEAGSMSSSASHNQLELPRGANRYFGYSFARYNRAQADIGHPLLFVGGKPFSNRKLAWHGDNGMERIYLPTAAQSGLAYEGSCVLFRRKQSGFQLTVMPWNDVGAVACRAASLERNTTFRLGAASPRICGLL